MLSSGHSIQDPKRIGKGGGRDRRQERGIVGGGWVEGGRES